MRELIGISREYKNGQSKLQSSERLEGKWDTFNTDLYRSLYLLTCKLDTGKILFEYRQTNSKLYKHYLYLSEILKNRGGKGLFSEVIEETVNKVIIKKEGTAALTKILKGLYTIYPFKFSEIPSIFLTWQHKKFITQ